MHHASLSLRPSFLDDPNPTQDKSQSQIVGMQIGKTPQAEVVTTSPSPDNGSAFNFPTSPTIATKSLLGLSTRGLIFKFASPLRLP
ncbi:unnamed protein product [Cutaneotrichosporon oleaginosum]